MSQAHCLSPLFCEPEMMPAQARRTPRRVSQGTSGLAGAWRARTALSVPQELLLGATKGRAEIESFQPEVRVGTYLKSFFFPSAEESRD